MKTKEKSANRTPVRSAGGFDAVKFMREQRDRISKDIMNLSPEEIVNYFEQRKNEKQIQPSA
ncbi:hypothetical protein ABIB40_003410 [Pedobacter sp. UYP30]